MTRPVAEERPRPEASAVPPHVERSVATIVELHTAHYREAGALQKAVSRATGVLARPVTVIVITVAIVSWVSFNLALLGIGRTPPDPFPFPLLSAAVSTLGLVLTAMILIAQRHDDELSTRRNQLALELALLSEQKSAKIIALLEVFRRNDPNQGDHRDELAEALAEPADPQAVLDAIEAAHANAPPPAGAKDGDANAGRR